MSRKSAVMLVVGLLAFLAFAAWFDVSGRGVQSLGHAPTGGPATAEPTKAAPSPAVSKEVQANRSERQGPDWSPPGVVDADGKPLVFGRVVPGAFAPVPVGAEISVPVKAGFMERDPRREEACEGTFWKWKGRLSEGLDVIVGRDQRIVSLGMTKPGLETLEGISIGNSYAAVDKTYGDRLEGPVRMEYGQAGVFLRDGDKWIGFGFDNEPGKLADDSRVAFIEVSRGARPGLIRDGC